MVLDEFACRMALYNDCGPKDVTEAIFLTGLVPSTSIGRARD